jgi:hypothetical protein
MEISGLSSHNVYSLGTQKLEENDLALTGVKDEEPEIEIQGTEPTPVVIDPETEDNENVRGVIRNLQNGHFKGVADVRLRINFHDEIAAIEENQLRTTADEKIGVLLDSMENNFTEFFESDDFSELHNEVKKYRDAFDLAVNDLHNRFITGDGLSKEDLLAGLEDNFQNLTGSLGEVLSGINTGIVTEEPDLEENADETDITANPLGAVEDVVSEQEEPVDLGASFNAFIEELKSGFDTALDQFARDLNEVAILPELSSPKGNGVAYSKFLAMYNELLNSNSNVDTQTSSDDEQFEAIA